MAHDKDGKDGHMGGKHHGHHEGGFGKKKRGLVRLLARSMVVRK